MLSVPIYNTFMVENYTSEWELDPLKDTQILFVLRQMLRIVDDFLEDMPLEEIGNLAPFCSSHKAWCFLKISEFYLTG